MLRKMVLAVALPTIWVLAFVEAASAEPGDGVVDDVFGDSPNDYVPVVFGALVVVVVACLIIMMVVKMWISLVLFLRKAQNAPTRGKPGEDSRDESQQRGGLNGSHVENRYPRNRPGSNRDYDPYRRDRPDARRDYDPYRRDRPGGGWGDDPHPRDSEAYW